MNRLKRAWFLKVVDGGQFGHNIDLLRDATLWEKIKWFFGAKYKGPKWRTGL